MSENRSIELLAPAGSMECLHAAVRAGANAVYLGLDDFNARRNAQNFTLDTLHDACDYAHLRGVAVYVTMNIEILPREIERAIDTAREAYLRGADAFIVQDIGLASELRQAVPDAGLHISTQMNTHNAAGIEAAAMLGASRITLARELALEEIGELAQIAESFDMEIECFAHGALCVCYSGQCLMSSMIGGRSANRGLCAQACRLPYELHRNGTDAALPAPGEHLLSPKDLCTIDLLADLQNAGVASLKIEGRMKSADYVSEVVSVYREALDANAPATPKQHARLEEAFSRGFTTAYLEGKRGNEIMSYGRPNNRGVFVGRVTRAENGIADVKTEVDLNDGDVVEFWTNRGHFAATVPRGARSGSTASVPVDQKTGKGDRVFRVRNAAAAFEDDPLKPRIAVTGNVDITIGKKSHISFRAGKSQAEAFGKEVEPARTKALTQNDVREHVDRLGQTPFKLENLDVTLSENAGMGFSQLHHLRSNALDALADAMLEPHRHRSVPDFKLQATQRRHSKRNRNMEVVAWATNPGCSRAAKRAGADALFIPLLNFKRGQSQLAGVRQEQPEQAGYPKQCVMALPAIDHDPVSPAREQSLPFDMWDYVKEGKRVFADSLAGIMRAISVGATVEAGPHVPVTNAATLDFLERLGVSRVWLSPELTLGQIADLAEHSNVELGIFASGAQELMITEHCLLMSQGPCNQECETCPRRSVAHYFVDRKGFEFPIVTDALGRSHLYNGVELDALPALPDLLDIGISAVMVDTTLLDKKTAESAVSRAVRARDLALAGRGGVEKRKGATTGHLFRGVS